MRRAVIDILTPKQARFFSIIGNQLRRAGFEVKYTARDYYESNRALSLFGIRAIKMGKFGETLYEKVLFSSKRLESYVRFLHKFNPEFVLSVGSPEAARAAFGLGIPHFMVSDTPHAEAVARLSVPLSRKLFTPWIIPKSDWSKYGINGRDIRQYRAVDQAAWIRRYVKLRNISQKPEIPLLVYRPEEFKAAHAFLQKPISLDLVSRLLNSLRNRYNIKPKVIALARYGYSSVIREKIGVHVIIPKGIVDGAELLTKTSLFISGGGGTMLGEASLLGVPSISLSPFENHIEKFFINKGLAFKSDSFKKILEFSRSALVYDEDLILTLRKASTKTLNSMVDPTNEIVTSIKEILD